jgi:hypothetical protein
MTKTKEKQNGKEKIFIRNVGGIADIRSGGCGVR